MLASSDRLALAKRATLSVCCIANSPGPFLRAALSPLRQVADEIVIAAGGPVSEEDLQYYGEIADQLFSIEFDFVERHLGWLHAQCRGDWILRFDGDEVPSPELISVVRATLVDRHINSLAFARRNLFPRADSYLIQEPWYPDFQVRMVRNDGTLRFAGIQHSAAERVLPSRMTEAAIYHLPFLLSGVDVRRARAQRYETLRPGLIAPTGLPANDALLPEDLPDLVTAHVPAEHSREIATALAATGPVPPGPANAVSVSLAEMDAYWPNRNVAESAYQAAISAVGAAIPLAPEESRPIYFRIRNEGSERWGWDPSLGPYFHVVHRLLDGNNMPMDDWRPSFFTEWVEPGATTIVPAQVDAPLEPGHYVLEVGVRHSPQERLFGITDPHTVLVRPGGAWARGSRRSGAPSG
jgi:hypothetical protein